MSYYAKAVNIIVGGKGGGVVYNDVGTGFGAVALSTANSQNKSLGVDLSQDGSFRIDGQRLYSLSIHNNYALHNIVIDIKGKGFQFYTLPLGRWQTTRHYIIKDLNNRNQPFSPSN